MVRVYLADEGIDVPAPGTAEIFAARRRSDSTPRQSTTANLATLAPSDHQDRPGREPTDGTLESPTP
ncbi:MAG: hypothetical protein P8J59_04645 [Phycisphaerales bacterium]|nr:hypothetical protein [Phycisphaerales bacterium]